MNKLHISTPYFAVWCLLWFCWTKKGNDKISANQVKKKQADRATDTPNDRGNTKRMCMTWTIHVNFNAQQLALFCSSGYCDNHELSSNKNGRLFFFLCLSFYWFILCVIFNALSSAIRSECDFVFNRFPLGFSSALCTWARASKRFHYISS